MIDALLDLINDPIHTALWGGVLGFFIRHRIARQDEKMSDRMYDLDKQCWVWLLKETKELYERKRNE
jgi:hypothetical protein